MTKSKRFNRFLSVLLAAAMVISAWSFTARAEETQSGEGTGVTWEKIENNGNGLLFKNKEAKAVFEETYIKDGMVRVSILLEAEPALDRFPAYEIAANPGARNYRQELRRQQNALADRISREVLGGETLDVVWNLTLVGNIISANVPYNKIEDIKAMLDVKDVVIETLYEADDVIPGTAEPNMTVASQMVGGDLAWAAGYTGAGSKVAVIDTGLDLTHELFDGAAFEYAIAEVEAEKGTAIDLMTEDELMAMWADLNIGQRVPAGEGAYKSAKVPFGANYAARNLDPTHLSGAGLSEHGSHVSGIATANRYIPDGNGGFVSTAETVKTVGEAPDAQLLAMQTFGSGGTTSDSDYMVAVEDAIWLGADAVNLSLGSSSLGFTTNSFYQELIDRVATVTNLVWLNSAGNNYDYTEPSLGALYDDDVSYATGGSPATYPNTLSTASIDNIGATGVGFTANGIFVIYNDTQSGYGNAPMPTIAGEYEYVLINGPGVDDNTHVGQEGDQFLALGEEAVAGKIAMCFRGTSSFFAKANAAVEQGAVGVVIINNQPGTINMNLTGYTHTAPAVTITQAEGRAILAASEPLANEAGIDAYTGTIKIHAADDIQVSINDPGYLTMSDFSSWGIPGDLTMKPEITAPGGNIYSTNGAHYDDDGNVAGGPGNYELMSGTSMASPQMAGLVAVLAQYIRENDLVNKTGRTQRQLALSLLMSTSEPVIGADGLYSILKQGSGLVDIEAAINAKSYITIDEVLDTAPASAATAIADGKVKVELGQVLSDSVTATFTLHNFSEEDVDFYLSGDFFTQEVSDGYRWQEVTPLTLALAWTVDGVPFEPTDADKYDFNGDGAANGVDAQLLLDVCSGVASQEDINPNSEPDMDGDGDIDTYDARLAFELLNNAGVTVPAGESKQVVLTVSGLRAALGSFPNGNYIEGFIKALEGETEDGALGVAHTIPVLGFWGNWTDSSMFDKGSYVEYMNGLEDRLPYMAYGTQSYDYIDGSYAQGFFVQYPGDNNRYFFGGNPVAEDSQYYPERNAISPDSVITGVQYTLIRNAAARRFFVTNTAGKEIGTPVESLGQAYSAYYYRSQAQWRNTYANFSIGYSPVGSNGTKLNLNFQAAPEYYVNRGLNWSELGEGSIKSIPFVIDGAAPTIVDVEENETTLDVIAHDNEYIAAVALWTEDGKQVDVFGGLDGIRKAEQHTYSFDLAELFEEEVPAHLLVEVYDYAANLSTYKINFNKEELENDVTLTLSETEVRVLKGNTVQLSASVEPWGAPDEVIWSSSDTSIATVDEFGVVTGVAKGNAVITATYGADPSIEATCAVEVFLIPMTLYGALQDANGKPVLFSWDIENDETWEPLEELPDGMTAMTLNSNDPSKAYFQDWDGLLHQLNTDTLEIEVSSAGTSAFGAPMEDIAVGKLFAANNDVPRIMGVSYGQQYALYSSGPEENGFGRGWSVSSYGVSSTAAIAFEARAGYDYFYVLGTNGNVVSMGFDSTGVWQRVGRYVSDLKLNTPTQLGDSGSYGNSMIGGDDYNFYLAHFNGTTSEIWQLHYIGSVNGSYTFQSSFIGTVGDDVWPVVLLGATTNTADGGNAVPEEPEWHKEMLESMEEVDETIAEPLELEYVNGQIQEVGGGTDAIRRTEEAPVAEPDKVKTEVTVEIAAEELTKNGLITIEVPEGVILKSWESEAQYQSMNGVIGDEKLVFAFVDLEGFEVDETLITLVFDKESVGTATITTDDINEQDDEEPLVETVVFGPAEHSKHTYGEPTWEWTITLEGATAKATFVCEIGDDTQVLEATVERNEEKQVFVATVTFEEKEYTNEFPIPAAWIERNSEPVFYFTLQEAFDSSEAGETIYLMRTVAENVVVGAEKEVTLDLNDHMVSNVLDPESGEVSPVITVLGTLTLDNSGQGIGGLVGLKAAAIEVADTGNLTVENAVVIGIDASALVSASPDAVVTVNGGVFVTDVSRDDQGEPVEGSEPAPVIAHTGESHQITVNDGHFSQPIDNDYVAEGKTCSEDTVVLDAPFDTLGELYYITDAEEVTAEINAASMTIANRLDANIFVIVPEEAVKAVATYSYADSIVEAEQEFIFAEMEKDARGRYKLVVENIPAKEMTEVISIRILDAQDNELTLVQTTAAGTLNGNAFEFRVVDYANNVLIPNANVNFQNIGKALLNYGEVSQIQFNHKTEDLANPEGYLAEEMAALKINDDYTMVFPNNDESFAKSTLGYQSMTLNLEGATQIYLNFDHEVTATDAEGNAYTVEPNGNRYRVVIDQVLSNQLNKMFTVIINEGGTDYTFQVSALSYANRMISNAAMPETLKNVCKALYLYNEAAIALFGN